MVPLCAPLPLPLLLPSLLLLLLLPLASGGVLGLPWLPAATPTNDEDDDEEQCSEVYFFLGTRALKVAVLRLAEGLGLLLELAALPLLSDDLQLLGRSSDTTSTPPPALPPSPSRLRISSRSRSGVVAAAALRGVPSRDDSEWDEGGVCRFGDGDGEGGEGLLDWSCSGLLLSSGWPRFLPALARVDGGEGLPPFFSGFMALLLGRVWA